MAENFELMNAVLEKLARVVLGPETVTGMDMPKDSYISFCSPGIAVDGIDFDFGFTAPTSNTTSAASDFSSLVNSIPPTSGRFLPSDRKLYDVYQMILRDAVLPHVKLSQQEQNILNAARSLLVREVDTIDIATGGVVKKPADTPLFEAYKERETTYLNTALAYKSLQVTLLFDERPQAKTEWALKGPLLEKQVRAAFNSWIPVRDQVLKALGAIQTIGERGPEVYWSNLKANLDRSIFSTPEGDQYFLTKYFPGKFWDAAHVTGWSDFTFNHEEVHELNEQSTMDVSGGGSTSFGLWSIGGSASYSEQREYFKGDTTGTSFKVKLTVVPLRRTWFDASVLENRAWKFDPGINKSIISDGKAPGSGLMPSYITGMILARDLSIKTDMTSTENEHVATQTKASANVGWGPFSVRGNYSRTTDRKTHDFVRNAAGIEAPGMQIIGFICQRVQKMPDPDDTLNWAV
ncbi:MAG TPA: hypothetical protein VIL69_02690 [Roseomonas sp.]|jgi:hypothetical protein